MSELPKANKSLGQHWLADKSTLEDICDFANLSQKDTVLEVGPGLGTLTENLTARVSSVVAVEYDQKLAQDLAAKYANTNVRVVYSDILKYDLTQLPPNYKLVANIPYYLTSNLLRRVLESSNPPSETVLLVQKEVAQRIAAKPGDMSLLSVSVQFYCDVELGQIVPAHLFTPPPKVDSQVIKLTYRTKPLFNAVDTKEFFDIVRAGFSERRKKLGNSLGRGLSIGKDELQGPLEKAGVSPDARAQELSLQDWYKLYEVLK